MTEIEIRSVLAGRIDAIRRRISAACVSSGRSETDVTLVAVTKTVSPRVAAMTCDLGLVDLGENRPQSLWSKADAMQSLPIRWHMIGHLQRTKVDQTIRVSHLIHAVDSLRLLHAIAAAGANAGVRPKILFQINVSREEQKHGFAVDDLVSLESEAVGSHVELVGLMGMAAISENAEDSRPAFRALRELRDKLRVQWPTLGPNLKTLSMGMSGDFEIAIEEGATIVRVGTALFEGLEEV